MVNICSVFTQLFGSACTLCGAPADGLCADCLASLPRNTAPCVRCALPLPLPAATGPATLCAECQSVPTAFDRVTAPLVYRRPVDELIAAFKYHRRLPLGRTLAAVLGEALRERTDLPPLLLPVPASAGRLRERGFDQAGELAARLARTLGVDCRHHRLVRVHEVARQRGLGRRQRRSNLRGAFAWRGPVPARVALVDDVMTTGATVEAASRVLKEAGVAWVEVWAVARTPRE